MKKLLYLFIASIILISCNSNNEDNDSIIDPIIGKWQLISATENGIEKITNCEKKNTVEFYSDNTLSGIYFEGIGNNGCTESRYTDKWSNEGNSIYKVDDEPNKISFSENNTIFSFTEVDGQDTYKNVFKKI